jgi:hypothetical protein
MGNMVKVLMIMHHIPLYTPYIALVNCDHLLNMRVDHAEPESEFQVEHAQVEDFTNLAWIKVSPDAPNHRP